jgi:hypothetical protein
MMAAAVLALCAVTITVGERIGVNGGQGWDGAGYTTWAKGFSGMVLTEGLTRYHSQRILPSAIVHYALRGTGQALTTPHVIVGFQVLNSVLLIASAVLWAHIGKLLAWRRSAAWAGFVALFASFACARHALYYPTLTDTTAFALGMLMTWGYVARRPIAVWWSALLGAFTWPALVPQAFVMLLAPRREPAVAPVEVAWQRRAHRLALWLAMVVVAAYLSIVFAYYRAPVRAPGFDHFAAWVRTDLLVLTVPLLALLLGIGLYLLLAPPEVWNLRAHWRHRRPRYLLCAAGSLAAIVLVWWWWVREIGVQRGGPTSAQFVCVQALEALRGPLWGLVHHVVYFGPIVLIAVLSWRRAGALAARWGPAATASLALTLVFAAGSESRQWINLVPFLVTITIAVTEERWTARRTIAFSAVALVWSKLWFPIGYDTPSNWLEFPNQRYFMNLGPWASDRMYLVHLVAAVASLLVMYLVIRPPRRAPPSSRASSSSFPGDAIGADREPR